MVLLVFVMVLLVHLMVMVGDGNSEAGCARTHNRCEPGSANLVTKTMTMMTMVMITMMTMMMITMMIMMMIKITMMMVMKTIRLL